MASKWTQPPAELEQEPPQGAPEAPDTPETPEAATEAPEGADEEPSDAVKLAMQSAAIYMQEFKKSAEDAGLPPEGRVLFYGLLIAECLTAIVEEAPKSPTAESTKQRIFARLHDFVCPTALAMEKVKAVHSSLKRNGIDPNKVDVREIKENVFAIRIKGTNTIAAIIQLDEQPEGE